MSVRRLWCLIFLGCGVLFGVSHAPASRAATCVQMGGPYPCTPVAPVYQAHSVNHRPDQTYVYMTPFYTSAYMAAVDLGNWDNQNYCGTSPYTCNKGFLNTNPRDWWDSGKDIANAGSDMVSVNSQSTYPSQLFTGNIPYWQIVVWGDNGPRTSGYPPNQVIKELFTFQNGGQVNELHKCPGQQVASDNDVNGVTRYFCRAIPVTNYNDRQTSRRSGLDTAKDGCACSPFPVDFSTQLKISHEVDYRGHSPYPIVWDRYYNIRGPETGWHFGYVRSVTLNLFNPDGNPRATFIRPDGGTLTFVGIPNANNDAYVWSVDPKAAQLPAEIITTLTTTSGTLGVTGYQLHNYQDETESYDQNGQLVSITNRAGRSLHFINDSKGRLSQITDDFGDQLTIEHDNTAQTGVMPSDPSDPFGQPSVTTNYWNSALLMAQEKMVSGIDDGTRAVVYNYTPDAKGTYFQMTSVGQSDSSVITYTYGEKLGLTVSGGNAVIAPDPLASSSTDNLTGVIGADGQRLVTYFYDDHFVSFKVSAEALGTGLMPLRFTGSGFLDVNGNSYSYGADSYGRSTGARSASVCPPNMCSGLPTGWKNITYDSSGHAASMKDFMGNTLTRAYDQVAGTLLSRSEATNVPALTRTTTYTWDPRFRLPTSTVEPIAVNGVPGTRTTTMTYDDRGNPLTMVVTPSSGEPARASSATYDAAGFLATKTGDNGATTTFAYNDSTGQLESWTDALGHTTTVGNYTAEGLPRQTVDANGLETELTYDLRDRITQIRRGSSTPGSHWETVQVVYQPSGTGLVDHLVLTDGRQVVFTYNSAQWLLTTTLKGTTGATLGSITYTYNVMGDPTGEQWFDASGAVITTETVTYDTFHRLSTSVGSAAQTSTVTYDAQSRPLTVKDPNGNVTKQTYDALGRVVTLTDALNHTATLAYDPSDAVTSATDFNGHATTSRYNGFGDLVSRTSPDSGTWTFAVDGAGRTTGITDARGATTAVTYDSLDRPTQIVYDSLMLPVAPGLVQGTETQTFTYDACTNGVGHLCSMTDASGTTAYTYDLWGRVTSKAFTPTGLSSALAVGYGYDTAGRLVTLTYPSGKVLTQSYGTDGELSGLTWDGTPILNAITHRPVGGEVTGWAWHSVAAGTVNFAFDADSQLTNLSDNAVQGTARTLGYDPGGRLTSVTVAGNANWNQVYGYDKADHLISATLSGYPGGLTYGYDLNGNRTSTTNGATSYSLTTSPTSNRLTAVTQVGGTATNLTNDANGNLISDGLLSLAYDAKNRLATASGSAGGVTYGYNAQGQRTFKQVVGGPLNGTERYVYGPGGVLLGVYDGAGTPIEETVYLDDGRPVALVRSGLTYPILTDQLGTPRQVLDPVAGTPVWTWEAKEPFGSELPNQTVSGTTFTYRGRFPGQVFDPDTGLVHNGFRDYLASVGRYVESDPIGLAGGWNAFAYVTSSPFANIDFWGLAKGLWLKGGDSWVPGHQALAVGDEKFAVEISFGLDSSTDAIMPWVDDTGHVYIENPSYPFDLNVINGNYYSVTDKQASDIEHLFSRMRNGEQGQYRLLTNNCRDFSQKLLRNIVNALNLKKSPVPKINAIGN